jgi:hypothetical protein
VEIDQRGAAHSRVDAIRVIDTRSGESETLWRAQTSYANRSRYLEDFSLTAMRWSSDGQTLYALRRYWDRWARSQAGLPRYQLMRWSLGEPGLKPIGTEIEASHVRLLVPPAWSGTLLLVSQYESRQPEEYGPPRVSEQEALEVDKEGHTRRLPTAHWPGFRGSPGRELGFDSRGRLIYLAAEESESGAVAEAPVYRSVEALDLTTGEVARIYP